MALNLTPSNISGPRQSRLHLDPERYANGTLMSAHFEQLSGSKSLIFTMQTVSAVQSFPRKFTRWKTIARFQIYADGDSLTAFTKFAIEDVPDAAEGPVLRVKVHRNEDTVEEHFYNIRVSAN